ncbi:MAG: hypothetical protein H6978_04230 [Gammaproteobacteria bacterium]|nr:hypothetical protein [Gammaproteobacteria bacterium]
MGGSAVRRGEGHQCRLGDAPDHAAPDTPASIEVVIVNGDPNPDRPDLPSYGAGEASHKPMIAAVANAVFDATGVRLRRVPFRKERVLEALRSQT